MVHPYNLILSVGNLQTKVEVKAEIKTEKMDESRTQDRSIGKPPPEKKPKLLR